MGQAPMKDRALLMRVATAACARLVATGSRQQSLFFRRDQSAVGGWSARRSTLSGQLSLNHGLRPELVADNLVFAIHGGRRRNALPLEVVSCQIFSRSMMATSSAAMEGQGMRPAVAPADSEQPAISGHPEPRSLDGIALEAEDSLFSGQTKDRNSVMDSEISLDIRGSLRREILPLPGEELHSAAKHDRILHRRSAFDLSRISPGVPRPPRSTAGRCHKTGQSMDRERHHCCQRAVAVPALYSLSVCDSSEEPGPRIQVAALRHPGLKGNNP